MYHNLYLSSNFLPKKKLKTMFLKMAAMLSLFLMFAILAESRSTLIGIEKDPFAVTCNQVVGAKAGDDCTSIGDSFKLGLESLLAINPNINCLAIFAGQWVCVDGSVSK
ncbi:peptidoglycan-binding lysin domain-containing protein [Tanacetum coccineum]